MTRADALDILGLDHDASPDDVKRRGRELMKKFHPDVNKDDPNAEQKFKDVNAALDAIKNDDGVEHVVRPYGGDWNSIFESMFGSRPTTSGVRRNVDDVRIDVNLSFRESVLGCMREVSYAVDRPCATCGGRGVEIDPSSCAVCKGRGHLITRKSNVTMQTPCPSCMGRVRSKKCTACGGSCAFPSKESVTLRIPSGVMSGAVLSLRVGGHFVGVDSFGSAMFTKVSIFVTVDDSPDGLTLDHDGNVSSSATVRLIDALKGTTIDVPTVNGLSEIVVPPRTRHGDVVEIHGAGVERLGGRQIVKINVEYPDDVSSIVDALTT